MTQPNPDTADLVLKSYDPESGVARLTFNRPAALNALDLATATAFATAVAELPQLTGLRCVVLEGAGRAFVAGGDVTAFAADPDHAGDLLDQLLDQLNPAILTLCQIDAPVIAAVNGTAAGAGFSLVLAADYVIARRDTRFVLAYDRLATTPDCGGSWFLARKLGTARAFAMMLTGAPLSAEQAFDLGIVSQLSDEANYHADREALIARIASGPTRAFGQFKELMAQDRPLAEQLEAERLAFRSATHTEDFKAACRAFVEKRTPSYCGR